MPNVTVAVARQEQGCVQESPGPDPREVHQREPSTVTVCIKREAQSVFASNFFSTWAFDLYR